MTTLERDSHEIPSRRLDDALAQRQRPGWNIARIFAVLVLLTILMMGVLKLLTMKA